MLRTWLEPAEVAVPEDFAQSIGGNPLVSKVLYSRGIMEVDSARGYLFPQEYQPTPASTLPGVEEVGTILKKAISDGKVIGVWGDFDVDGQTATTVFVSALRQVNGKVTYHIPIRATESHGIALPALQKFIQGGVQLILTCDTGITSHDAIEYAQQQGAPVLITDHHDLPSVLPKARAIVNPKILPAGHPLSTLPGVGVAYKVVEYLLQLLEVDMSPSQYLDLVALGIVADIALLKGDTRYLLQRGLEALRSSQRVGLLAMMELAELNQSNITEEHIGYVLAPRLNAVGRLDDANQMVELLTTSDMGRARILALQLEGMNAQRKLLTDQVFQAAQAQVSQNQNFLDFPVLVLSHPSWPAGVVGVVASRLVEQYHRPVILLSTPPGEDARGSARSIEAVNITSAIAANKEFVKAFGGHPMAAGMVINPDRIDDFRRAISRTVESMGVEIQTEKSLQIDGYLSLPDLSLDLVEDLERMAPFGAGNPPLVLATRNLKLTGYAAVGHADEHLLLTIEDELGHTQRSIWWQGAGNPLPEGLFDLAYSVRASTYRGQRDVQVEWVDYRLAETPKIPVSPIRRAFEVVDFRSELEPVLGLNSIHASKQAVVWGEANPIESITCLDRNAISPAEALVVWTIPPGSEELRWVLQTVRPIKIYLFGVNPGMDEPEAFLKRLLGLMKYRIKSSHGHVNFSTLAAATAQRESAVKTGLEWLAARGYLNILSTTNEEIHVEGGNGTKRKNFNSIATALNHVMAESAAFRRYYLKADKDRLLAFE